MQFGQEVDKAIPTAGWAVVQCVVSGTLWAGNTPLGMRGAQAEQSFGNLVSNQLTLGPSTLEVRAAVTLTVPLGGPAGQALGFNAAVCQCLRNGSASAQRETGMASHNGDVLSKLANHRLHQSQPGHPESSPSARLGHILQTQAL